MVQHSGWLGIVEDRILFLSEMAMAAMLFQIVLDVAGKYILAYPLPGTIEIVSNYYMVAITFLPLAALQARGGHIKVEVFTHNLPQAVQRALDQVAALLAIAYVGALIWMSGKEALWQTADGENWNVMGWYMPIWPARWIVPVGLALFLLRLALDVLGRRERAVAGSSTP